MSYLAIDPVLLLRVNAVEELLLLRRETTAVVLITTFPIGQALAVGLFVVLDLVAAASGFGVGHGGGGGRVSWASRVSGAVGPSVVA